MVIGASLRNSQAPYESMQETKTCFRLLNLVFRDSLRRNWILFFLLFLFTYFLLISNISNPCDILTQKDMTLYQVKTWFNKLKSNYDPFKGSSNNFQMLANGFDKVILVVSFNLVCNFYPLCTATLLLSYSSALFFIRLDNALNNKGTLVLLLITKVILLLLIDYTYELYCLMFLYHISICFTLLSFLLCLNL